MSKLKPRERILLLVVVPVVAVALWLTLTAPSPGGARPRAERGRTAAQIRDQANTLRLQAVTLRQESAALQPRLQRATYARPPEAITPEVIRMLQAAARQSGVTLQEIKPLRAEPLTRPAEGQTAGRAANVETGLIRVPVSVRLSAPFARLVDFLYLVEEPSTRLVVESFRLNPPREGQGGAMEAELQLAALALAPESEERTSDARTRPR